MPSTARVLECAGCGAPVGSAAVACDACGTPAEPAQRRVVTLLFADLAGYTTLCETRDPEQVHLLVRPLMNALRTLCEERGGVVSDVQGDGFMAVFGARVAREDDPARALDAAVQLQRAVEARQRVLSEIPGLRVGLHVGEVLVAPSLETMGVAVSGDAVNVASRVCGLAPPGEVLATREAVELTPVETGWGVEREHRVRGRDRSVCARPFAWRDVPELVRRPRWSTEAPYVPRPEVERLLREALAQARRALVVGQGGMGKTRIVEHVLDDHRVLRAAASSLMRPSASALCAELLEQVELPSDELVRILRGGDSGGLSDEGLQLRAAGEQLGRGAVGAVLFVDDLELLDDDECERLVEALKASGLAFVLASREGRRAPGVKQVPVPPWTLTEAEVLLEALLPRASAELRGAVLERAGDCPLYVEQCARLLIENGAVEVDNQGSRLMQPGLLREIPSSMRLFVSSRLDLLPADQRHVLGTAAVLGQAPDLGLLHHLVGDGAALVDDLVASGYLTWHVGPADHPELRFSHALVREIAYETLLRSRRVEIHRAAAEWYAVLPVSQVLESQAHHLEAAVRLQEPDCDLLRRTVESMVLFARSIEEERTRVSREVLARARALVEERSECGADVLSLELASSSVEFLAGEQARSQQAADRALALATERSDVRSAAEAHLHLGRAHRYLDEARATRELELAAEHYTQVPDRAGVARVEIERGLLAAHNDGLLQHLTHFERAYHEAMRAADTRLQASCAQWIAMHSAFALGRAPFELWAARARDVSRRDDAGLEPRLDLALGGLAMFELRPAVGLEEVRRALAAGRDLGLAHVCSNAYVIALDLLALAGAHLEAETLLDEARSFAARAATPWLGLQLDLIEARLRQRGGRVSDSQELFDGVAHHEQAQRRVLRRDLAEARAWVALERGRFGEARALATDAVAVDEEIGERCAPLRPRLIELVASVAAGESVSLGTIADLRSLSRDTGLGTIAQLATRWLYVDELTRGWSVDLHGLQPCEVVECRALDLEIEALSSRRWERLLAAAGVWAELGTTVWHARALLWHSELTGTPSPEADELLVTLDAPDGLAELLRAQVRGLRT